MPQFGKLLIIAGLSVVALGLLVWAGEKLPGNFVWRTKSTTVYFPFAACVIVSIVGSLILWLIQRR